VVLLFEGAHEFSVRVWQSLLPHAAVCEAIGARTTSEGSPMNESIGNINIDGEVFEGVSMSPSDVFSGWVRVKIAHRGDEAVYHIPPQRIVWVLEGSSHGPLR
jgi:hypothetical protein